MNDTMMPKLSKTERKHIKKYFDTICALKDEIMGIDAYRDSCTFITDILMILATHDKSLTDNARLNLFMALTGEDLAFREEVELDVKRSEEYITNLDRYEDAFYSLECEINAFKDNPSWALFNICSNYGDVIEETKDYVQFRLPSGIHPEADEQSELVKELAEIFRRWAIDIIESAEQTLKDD